MLYSWNPAQMDQCLKKRPEWASADKTPEHILLDLILPEEFSAGPGRPMALVFEAMFLSSPEVERGMMPTSNEKEQKGISDLSIRLK